MNNFNKNIISIYGSTFAAALLRRDKEKGKAWLEALPQLVTAISSKLGLRDLKEVTNLTYNYVLSGFQGDNPIILKLGLDSEALKQEAFALKCFVGYGAVKVLAEIDLSRHSYSSSGGGLLLERAVPGSSLRGVYNEAIQEFSGSRRFARDDEAVKIACKVMQKLHQANIPTAHNFPHIKDPGYAGGFAEASWLAALDRHCEEFTTKQSRNDHTRSPRLTPRDDELFKYLKKARKLRDQLLKTADANVLLHGDLHHDNILQNGDDWMVIDPKGVIGSPINEVWTFVMDIERDIPFIAQYFNFSTQDVFNWYFVHIILAACWNLEDNIDASLFLKLAKKAYEYVS